MAAFRPNCTLPPDGVVYVAPPNIRTTLDILWSSLATIIVCTYSVLHLNVPEQRRGRDPGWKGDAQWALRRFGSKLKWCIITVFIPEYIFSKAIGDLFNARRQLCLLHRDAPETAQTITLTHMLFADMGGLALNYRPEDVNEIPSPTVNSESRSLLHPNDESYVEPSDAVKTTRLTSRSTTSDQDQVTPGASAPAYQMSKFAAHSQPSRDAFSEDFETFSLSGTHVPAPGKDRFPSDNSATDTVATPQAHASKDGSEAALWHFSACVLRLLIANKHILPDLPFVEEINDKSKSDLLTRSIVLLQICYYVLGVLVRLGHGLPICELELGTVAFVVCSALTYMITFQKPKSVETAIVLPGLMSAHTMRYVRQYSKDWSSENLSEHHAVKGHPPRNDDVPGDSEVGHLDIWTISGAMAAAVLFSSIHIAGWNLSFPSVTDMWIWRASAIASTSLPVIGPLWMVGSLIILENFLDKQILETSAWVIGGWPALLYVVARLALIVEMFRGLAYLPPEAFAATWTANVPHIG